MTIEYRTLTGPIADQDPSLVSIGQKLRSFAKSLRYMKVNDIDWQFLDWSDDDERVADALEDAIATVGRRCPPGYTIGWHPDYSNTLMFEREEWFR